MVTHIKASPKYTEARSVLVMLPDFKSGVGR